MSDTPRTDAAEHHQHDTNPPQPLGLVDAEVCRELERELNNANDRIAALEAHVARLEEAGDACAETSTTPQRMEWERVKGMKP
ncbi:MAG: hypothetical protein RL153_1417 [Verrucomicrobiota bacterium]|jgi:hypothetical protein